MSDFDKDIDARRSASALDRIRNTLSPERLKVAERVAKLHSDYISLDRDVDLREAFNSSVASVSTLFTGRPDKRRIVALVGRSGAGKSTAIAKHIANTPAMQPYIDEDGVEVTPVIVFDAPSPCTPRLFAIEGLEAMKHFPRESIKENEAWLLFKRLLKVHKVKWVVVDECQHAIEDATVREANVIGNGFKSITQMRDWSVSMILAGVPPLPSFLARKQLYNRRTIIPFDTLHPSTGNTELARDVLETIVVQHAGMGLAPDIDISNDGDFLARLSHAVDDEFGSAVQMIRDAVETALLAGREIVELSDFVKVYASYSGCRKSQNIFTASNWVDLEPTTALHRQEDHAWEEERAARMKRGSKFGVRPQ